jgi:hypothetical protein
MDTPIASNAFRVLSLPADAGSRDVYKQQQRLQNAIELGDGKSAVSFKFLPDLVLDTEMILDAVHRIERQRVLEELFWVHDLGGKFDLKDKCADALLSALRAESDQNTCKGAVAQHNLAVVLTSLARELSGSRRFEYWKEALVCWEKTLGNEIFWQFMEDRAETPPGQSTITLEDLRSHARKTLQRAVVDEVWSAIENREYPIIRVATQLVLAHKSLLDPEPMLKAISTKLIKDGSVAIGSVLDRIAVVAEGTDPNIIRKTLSAAEQDIRQVSHDFAQTLEAFEPGDGSAGWDDARATAFEKLSIVYFNLLDDPKEALRLVLEGQTLAHDILVKTRLDRDWKHVQRAILCADGVGLLKAGNYAAAEQKFAGALALSTQEQRSEVEDLLEACSRARVFGGVDTTKRSPGLFTLNGIGATFYGRRGFDPKSSTYITNHWFVFFFLPVFPIAAYRVSDAGSNSYNIHGQVPLSSLLKKYRWGVLAAIILLIVYAIVDSGSSPSAVTSPTSPTHNSAPSQASGPPAPSYVPSTGSRGTSDSPPLGGRDGGSYWPLTEKQAIEAERTELNRQRDSLSVRKQQVDQEGVALDQMDSYMRSVKTSYTAETIPEDVRTQYNSTVRDYNKRVPEYNSALEELKAEFQDYQRRVDAFNARVDRYNLSR